MTLQFEEIPQFNGGWFTPGDHKDAVAILVEVKDFQRQRPTPHGPKDSVLADVTVFATEADISNGTPSFIQEGCRIEKTVLTRDLSTLVGKATIVTLDQTKPSKPGQNPAWVWRPVATLDTKKAVVDYAIKREEDLKAAMDDAPPF